jgi:predicted acylesterase/phospholipase RssA
MTIKHLVLPGGGPMGIKAMGALQHLEQHGYYSIDDIKTIYATSAGAIASLLLALKFDWESIRQYLVIRPWHDTYSVNVSQLFDAYSKKGIFDESAITTFYKPFFLAKDLPLTMTMREFYEFSGIELHLFSLELNSFEIVDISYKTYPDISVIQSVHMSCAIPTIITPVCFDDKCFVDGGVVTNYPMKFCIEEQRDLDEIFGIVNMYEQVEDNIVNHESTILDYIVHFISKLVKKANEKADYNGEKMPHELKYEATTMTLDNMKQTLFSADFRAALFEKGVDSAKNYMLSLSEAQNGFLSDDSVDKLV